MLSHFSNHFYFSFLNKHIRKSVFEMYMKKKMLITSRETQYYYKYSDKEIIHTHEDIRTLLTHALNI
jgi:hypothetical protein